MQYIRLIMLIIMVSLVLVYHFVGQNFLSPEILLVTQDVLVWYPRYLLGTAIIRYAIGVTQWTWERHIQNILYLSHAIILAYIFLLITWGLPSLIAIGVVALCTLLLLGIQLSAWRRILCIVPASIAICLVIVVLSLPKYDTIPSKESFYNNFGTQLHIVVKDIPMTLRDISAEIILSPITNPNQQIRFLIQEGSPLYTSQFIARPVRIEFAASRPLYNTFAFVQFYDGSILPIPSQSIREISYTQTGYESILTGIDVDKNIEDAASFIATESSRLDDLYAQAYEQFIVASVGGEWTQHPIIDRIIGMSLYYLYRFFPQYYEDNYKNYQTIKEIIGTQEDGQQDRFISPENANAIRETFAPAVQQTRWLKRFIR